ncbi:glycoprotein-N-acetylgalactosamine 3-beta-galactosyltransferase 1 [Nematostella vectensis]|uniref:glycoprotein-N-acetylgalactosamine 3-beta-galactosyltransferase 1 n=1 Tax=Nematostella vectensis TaxID=45351 RepID=UPI0020770E26|nr:glycoprotein-N-acetylgalactosamine 3-beta-galactosyltransferase 1 [Nematostella vectensis]
MAHSSVFLAFVLGLLFGVMAAYITSKNLKTSKGNKVEHLYLLGGSNLDEYAEIPESETAMKSFPEQVLSSLNFSADMRDLHHRQKNNTSKMTKVLCWVLTSPNNLKVRGRPIKETWGKRCDVLLFMSTKDDENFPAVGLNVLEGQSAWHKTRAAWQYVIDNHINDADWFIKTDDETYVVIENLKHLCSKHEYDKSHYFGRHFLPFGGYNDGGAGYVFSKETLIRFGKLLKDSKHCPLHSKAEDVEVGRCLRKVGVVPGDTRDERKRETFHPFSPEQQLITGLIKKDNWLWAYSNNRVTIGPGCCSDHSVTFHHITPNMMYLMEYFVYHLRPYGITLADQYGRGHN